MGMSDNMIDKMIKRYQDTFIGETETVQYAAAGFGRNPILLAGGLLGALLGKPRVIVVTDTAIHLVKQKKADDLTPDDVIGTYPRQVEMSSTLVSINKIVLGESELRVGRRTENRLVDGMAWQAAAVQSLPEPMAWAS